MEVVRRPRVLIAAICGGDEADGRLNVVALNNVTRRQQSQVSYTFTTNSFVGP